MKYKPYKNFFSCFLILITLITLIVIYTNTALNKNNNSEIDQPFTRNTIESEDNEPESEIDQQFSRNTIEFEDNDLKIFKKSFLYKEKPIHPAIIERFMSYAISDGWKPKTISMDIVACPNTNEFYKEFEWSNSAGILICSLESEDHRGYFRYVWLGKLDNGLHVIKTIDSGGGSLTSLDLLFLKVSKGIALTPEGKIYSQILLTFVRNYCLSDDGEIKLLNNKVIISPSQYRDREIILDFPDDIDFN